MSMISTHNKYVSIYCLFVNTLSGRVHDGDMWQQTGQSANLDQTIPACATKRRGVAGRWANLLACHAPAAGKRMGYGG